MSRALNFRSHPPNKNSIHSPYTDISNRQWHGISEWTPQSIRKWTTHQYKAMLSHLMVKLCEYTFWRRKKHTNKIRFIPMLIFIWLLKKIITFLFPSNEIFYPMSFQCLFWHTDYCNTASALMFTVLQYRVNTQTVRRIKTMFIS